MPSKVAIYYRSVLYLTFCYLVITQFFLAFKHPLQNGTFQRLLALLVSSSKSSNPNVRINSVKLFKALVTLNDPLDLHNLSRIAVQELLILPKTGKTNGPEHRIALYSMLSYVHPAEGTSAILLQASTPLLAKEASESAVAVLAAALAQHIVFLLIHSSLPDETTQLIAKEMKNAKPAIRRAFVGLAGSVFFDRQGVLDTGGGDVFAKELLPSFEASLKAVSSNPLNSTGGPYEGYVAVAVLLGPFVKSKKFGLFERPVKIGSSLITFRRRGHCTEPHHICHWNCWREAVISFMGQSVSKGLGKGRRAMVVESC